MKQRTSTLLFLALLAVAAAAIGYFFSTTSSEPPTAPGLRDGRETVSPAELYREAREHMAQAQNDRAEMLLKSLAAENLPPGSAHLYRGDLRLLQGDYARALAHYRASLAEAPNQTAARTGRAVCLAAQREFEQALETLDGDDLPLFPDNEHLQHLLARILAAGEPGQIRDGSRALTIMENLIGKATDLDRAETFAMAWAETGEFQQAVAWQQTALSLARDKVSIERMEHMLATLQEYVENRPCRQPWPVHRPMLALKSFLTEGRDDGRPKPFSMKDLLAQLPQNLDPQAVEFLNAQRADMLSNALRETSDLNRYLELEPKRGRELLRAGRSVEAVEAFERLKATILQYNVPFEGMGKTWLLHELGLAYLRLGEQENCLISHTAASCILPIRGEGVHRLERGSRGAIEVFSEILREFPKDVKARWLLNLAYMTLGEYPGKVPKEWLVDPKVFEPEAPFTRFEDVAGSLGLDVDGLSGGSIAEDFDNDGLTDIMVSSWGLTDQMRYFRNRGDGGFEDRTEASGLLGQVGGLNMMQTDYNNDGYPDVLVLRGAWMASQGKHPNSLLRNDGGQGFTDVTEGSGLLSFHPTQTAAWLDFDNDGWLDLFIGNESSEDEAHPCQLYRNNGDGSFRECAAEAGIANVGFVKGVASGDFDNDGRTDLYLSRYTQPNILYRNMGPNPKAPVGIWHFNDVTEEAGVAEPILSFPTWFWDYDNDGWLDLFVSDYENRGVETVAADYLGLPHDGERARLYRNNRDGSFTDVTAESGLYRVLIGMGSNFGDADNDGWLDFYVGTGTPSLSMLIPNRLFRNAEGKRFLDVTAASGLGHLQKGHGVSFADLDHDGDQDIHIVMGGAYSGDTYRNALFENPGHGNHWVKLKLVGTQSNRAAIGARIQLEVTGASGRREIHRTIGSGGSFGASPLRAEIGLGKATLIEKLTLFWPASGQTQVFEKLAVDRCYRITENSAALETPDLHEFDLNSSEMGSHHRQ